MVFIKIWAVLRLKTVWKKISKQDQTQCRPETDQGYDHSAKELTNKGKNKILDLEIK